MNSTFRLTFLVFLFSMQQVCVASEAPDSLFAILKNEEMPVESRLGIARNSQFYSKLLESESDFVKFCSLVDTWCLAKRSSDRLFLATYIKCEYYAEKNKIGAIFILADRFKNLASYTKKDIVYGLRLYNRAYYNLGMVEEFVKTAPKLYHLTKNHGTVEEQAAALSAYCWALNSSGFYLQDKNLLDSCLFYHELFNQTMIEKNLHYEIILNNYATYLLVLKRTQKYDQTLDVAKEAIAYSLKNIPDEERLKSHLANFYFSISQAKFHLGETDSAFYYSELSLNYDKNIMEIREGPIYFLAKIGRYREASEKLDPLIFENEIDTLSSLYPSLCGFAAPIFEKAGRFEEAAYCYRKNKTFSDSLRKLEASSIQEYEQVKTKIIIESERNAARLATEKIELENKKQKEKKNSIILFVMLFAIAIAVFLFIVFRRYKITQKQNTIIESQKVILQGKNEIIEEKQKEIIDSINYAKRIQFTLLAHKDFLKENLNDHFVYFKPKDIVSGDFYWATKNEHLFYLAVCDSTGHGVPGAFMSLLSIGFLNEAIKEKGILKPNEVFNFVRERLIDNISKEGQKDGFDGILICIDSKTNQITYAAANNKPILIQDREIKELPNNRMPVGVGERHESFQLFSVDFKSGDHLYLYTDGYADQFGGPNGKKFKYKVLNELILTNSSRTTDEQRMALDSHFESWKGSIEQVDDVCVIGIRL